MMRSKISDRSDLGKFSAILLVYKSPSQTFGAKFRQKSDLYVSTGNIFDLNFAETSEHSNITTLKG